MSGCDAQHKAEEHAPARPIVCTCPGSSVDDGPYHERGCPVEKWPAPAPQPADATAQLRSALERHQPEISDGDHIFCSCGWDAENLKPSNKESEWSWTDHFRAVLAEPEKK